MTPSIPLVTADVLVRIEPAGDVMAMSGRTGDVIAQSTDASLVIQKAIDALPTTGGKVFLAAGCYWLDATVMIEDKHGVHLEGAGRGIVFSGGMEGTALRSKKDIDLVCVFGNRIKVAGVSISNLHLIGSGKNNGKAGLLIRGDSDLLSLHNVGANHCGIGFHFQGGGGQMLGVIDAPQVQFCDPQANGIGILIERCHYGKFIGGEVSDCDQYGIVISAPEPGLARTQGIKISGFTGVRNGLAGILIGKNTEDITLTGGTDFGGTLSSSGIVVSDEGTGHKPRNIIIADVHSYNNRDAGILVDSAAHVVIHGCICSSHDHSYVENRGQRYGIHIRGESEHVLVNGNLMYGNSEKDLLDETTS